METATINARMPLLNEFKKAIKGNIHEGKLMTLFHMLANAVDIIYNASGNLKTNPRGTVKVMSFLMKNTAVIEELLDPLSEIKEGSLKPEEFFFSRIPMYKSILLNQAPTFANSDFDVNYYGLQEQVVYRQILSVMDAK